MKKFLLIMLFFAASAVNANYIMNSGFESMSGDPLALEDWTEYKGSGATVYFAAKTDVVYEGTTSYKIAARNGYGMLHQTITGFTGGESLSFWLYGRGDTNGDWQMDEVGDQVDVYIKFKDAGGSQIGDEVSMVLFDADEENNAAILSTTDWLKSPVLSFVTPEDTAQIQVKIRSVDGSADGNNHDGTSVYLDSVTLVPEPATMTLLGLGGLVSVLRRNRK